MLKRVFLIGGMSFLLAACAAKIGPPEDIEVEITAERLVRGEYLVEQVTGCMDCHSHRDWSRFMAPLKEEGRGAGGERWGEELGFPGTMYSPNITPAHLGEWTDGEIIRAFTSGVARDGTPLFPIMPYQRYGRLAREDVYSIVAYLRTLEPVERTHPSRKLNFPLNLIVKSMPREAQFRDAVPEPSDRIAYGEYMINAAVCGDCHTPTDSKGRPLENMDYAGGFRLTSGDGTVMNSANLTPHETGLATWSREQFIQRFKALDTPAAAQIPLQPGQKNTIMPWLYYARMKASDLGAIYDYLRSIPARENAVIKYPEEEDS